MAKLVVRARRGDATAFGTLYERFARSVHAVLLARLPPSDAEEMTQEVFLAALQRLGELREAEQFGPWLHAMARNRATDHLRARKRRPPAVPLIETAAPERPDGELRGRVLEHVRSLPEAYRETLVMRLVEGLPGPDIAKATGLTAASVRVNLHRGMELLRTLLRKDGWPW